MNLDQKRAALAALQSAIDRGVEYVSYDGNQIKYRSIPDMILIRNMMRLDLGIDKNPRRRPRRGVVRV